MVLYPYGKPRDLPEPLRLCVLGATGSIGEQTLDLVRRFGDRLELGAVAVRARWEPLAGALADLPGAAPLVAIEDPAARDAAAAAGVFGDRLLPVDSEHSALAQALRGHVREDVSRLILTASGGPFRTTPAAELATVTREQVLRHPTWEMGPKITVDSATLMNKGLEVIEAHVLFGIPYDRIDVVVHPGSWVHSLVELRDGAVVAQLGTPDMRLPLLYAITGEQRWPLGGDRLDLLQIGELRFEAPDLERFPCLALARAAGQTGGTAPAVLNAANEVAVAALLAGEIRYIEIPELIGAVLDRLPPQPLTDLQTALDADAQARRLAAELRDRPGGFPAKRGAN
jgi:1-deoxy-D-xylulose-5-phosphate reductoisomerase